MNYRLTLGLLLVASLLAVAVIGLERANVPSPQATPQSKAEEFEVFAFDDRQVSTFTLRSGEISASFEKRDDTWVVAGSGAPANRISLTSLLIRMSQLKASTRFADDSRDPTGYGVASPKAEMSAGLPDGTTHMLQFGNKLPIGTNTYVRKMGSEEVYVVPAQLLTDLERLVAEPNEPPTPTPRPTATATPEVPAGPVLTPTP